MDRRTFVSGISVGLLAAPFVEAQPQGRPYRVGVLNNSFQPNPPIVKGLRAGIKAEGFEEGRDVRFDVRSTGSDERTIGTLAAALANENPNVIVTIGERETRAASAAAPRVPIVFTQISDPVAVGLVASIARPGGRLTGISDLYIELVPKRLELAKELAPKLRRVLFVYDVQDSASAAAARKGQETAPGLKIPVVVRAVRTRDEAVRELKTAGVGDVLLAPAVASAPAAFRVRVWQITSWRRGPHGGDRRRRGLVLATLRSSPGRRASSRSPARRPR